MPNERNSIYEIRNSRWVRAGVISVEIKHPQLGWIPYGAIEGNDDTLAVYLDAVAMIGPYQGETPDNPIPPSRPIEELRANASISKADLLFRLHNDLKLISAEEAMAAVKTGEIPKVFSPLLAALPDDDRFRLELKWAGDSEISRAHPAMLKLATSLYGDKADAVLDGIFGVTNG